MRQETRSKPVTEYRVYKRNLPHIEVGHSLYFITFRTATDFTLSDQAKDIVFGSIEFHAGKRHELRASVVMDTHVHLVLQPLETQARRPVPRSHDASLNKTAFYGLAQITHSVKSYSANRIQKQIHWYGSIWLDENFDRIIRDDEEYNETMDYIINNPVKAGLVDAPNKYKWLYVSP